MSTRPQRGDVWQVEFGRPVGNEQGAGLRPAVVISNDGVNDSRDGLAIVAPLTTAPRSYPSRIRIQPGSSGLRETSWQRWNTCEASPSSDCWSTAERLMTR